MEIRLSEIDFTSLTRRNFFPSPASWADEVLYFMLLDRFSDGNENLYRDIDGQFVTTGATPPFQDSDNGNAVQNEADAKNWRDAGARFVGGTLKGLESKIGYLSRLGITAIWISPIFQQVPSEQTYHGYGIQYYLNVDPRFGSRDDLVSLVNTAHSHGIRVVLDIILNHAGDVFSYRPEERRCDVMNNDQVVGKEACWQSDGTVYGVQGFRNEAGQPELPYGPIDESLFPNAGVWPAEFQEPDTFTRKGRIRNFDFDPEFREGDFVSLKDIRLGEGSVDAYRPSAALMHLCEVFKFWIAFADIDGFRVDTVKHMDDGASRLFTSAIHEFAETIGKENFYLIAEITGGRERAFHTLETVGMNAALGINDIPDKVEYLVKGFRNPENYFNLFKNSLWVKKESHVWFRDRVVTTFDDHDQVRKGSNKSRFANPESPQQDGSQQAALPVLALLTTTMGIPCIYYGSEQQFDGNGDNDRYIREAMFGGAFGAFRSKGRHFFKEDGVVYRELAKILRIRKDNIVIRRGRQFLRQISGDGLNFGFPRMIGDEIRSVVAWSRIFSEREVLLAINTDLFRQSVAWVTIDNGLHAANDTLNCIFSTDDAEIGQAIQIEARNGKAVKLSVPPAGFVIYQ
ncbi:MAG TPA: alpha-amylase [Gammaproteobacteria bacterium]|nr:alpha-amylase [Gammaproteobacteria bacterium]